MGDGLGLGDVAFGFAFPALSAVDSGFFSVVSGMVHRSKNVDVVDVLDDEAEEIKTQNGSQLDVFLNSHQLSNVDVRFFPSDFSLQGSNKRKSTQQNRVKWDGPVSTSSCLKGEVVRQRQTTKKRKGNKRSVGGFLLPT
jgi:hypothetical protein